MLVEWLNFKFPLSLLFGRKLSSDVFLRQHSIYCTGELLRQVQTAKLFDDNKAFVDMKLTAAPEVVLDAFSNLTWRFPNGTVPASDLRLFVNTYFVGDGKEFEPWAPPDWHEKPKFLSKVSDLNFRNWAEELHGLWKLLGRKISTDVEDNPQLHSMIYVPNPVIVPGGRFTEFYYWDSYWVLNGLLLSEMTDTARGIIQNFLYMVDRYGFVPNGGRVYYERRSQPPFLCLMVESFYEATKDLEFIRQALPTLEKEYSFWMENQPPVSEKLWTELKAAAESGWDFSSRWYINSSGQNTGSFRNTSTSSILPVELNALMCRSEHLLATFSRILGDEERALVYDRAASARLKAIESVLWDAEKGAWFDYNLLSGARHPAFYPTNVSPLWAKCHSQPGMGQLALQYLKASGGLDYPNGIPTSLSETGQQWDMPNAWPPLQHILIEGLSQLDLADAKELAFDLAQRWIRTNWMAYNKYEAMFEKVGFCISVGFGWTNGVALQLLDQYGDSGCELFKLIYPHISNHFLLFVFVL
uniref:Trehalase n=1 Tax=Pygocentrus nattereri TaxID=42514 RepID=A0A3B4E1F5_PYGNA